MFLPDLHAETIVSLQKRVHQQSSSQTNRYLSPHIPFNQYCVPLHLYINSALRIQAGFLLSELHLTSFNTIQIRNKKQHASHCHESSPNLSEMLNAGFLAPFLAVWKSALRLHLTAMSVGTSRDSRFPGRRWMPTEIDAVGGVKCIDVLKTLFSRRFLLHPAAPESYWLPSHVVPEKKSSRNKDPIKIQRNWKTHDLNKEIHWHWIFFRQPSQHRFVQSCASTHLGWCGLLTKISWTVRLSRGMNEKNTSLVSGRLWRTF